MDLDPAAAAAGYRLVTQDTLPSTNAAALACAINDSDSRPLWLTARMQTAGRGRRGNAWISPRGNLYATLLLIDPGSVRQAPELSFVAALAVHDAILEPAPGLRGRLAFKWPNDVLCGGAKLAGILIEGRSLDPGLAVAIGIGVNCRHHPSQTAYPASDLAEAGVELSADNVFFALSRTMMRRLEQWRGGEGFSAVRSDWLDCAVGVGGDMRVRLPDRELFGQCQGIDESGRLLLRVTGGALEAIAAGDVFPLGNDAGAGLRLKEKIGVDGSG
ncbi:MAG: biotin--[acetyl-CoA-carboxylase] ligase [Xanthobacteraceae bacterium]